MPKVINIEQCFKQFNDTYSPKIVGELNGQNVMVVRCEGDRVPMHTHENEDEMFFVLEGTLDVYERSKKEGSQKSTLNPGEFTIVKKGIEHRVVPNGHVKLLLFEPADISHTGKVRSEITKTQFEYLEG